MKGEKERKRERVCVCVCIVVRRCMVNQGEVTFKTVRSGWKNTSTFHTGPSSPQGLSLLKNESI